MNKYSVIAQIIVAAAVIFVWVFLFENIENVWEVLPKIKSYAESKSSGKPLIGKGTVIKDNVVFGGPCIIGDNCIIGPNAYFRDGVIIRITKF